MDPSGRARGGRVTAAATSDAPVGSAHHPRHRGLHAAALGDLRRVKAARTQCAAAAAAAAPAATAASLPPPRRHRRGVVLARLDPRLLVDGWLEAARLLEQAQQRLHFAPELLPFVLHAIRPTRVVLLSQHLVAAILARAARLSRARVHQAPIELERREPRVACIADKGLLLRASASDAWSSRGSHAL